MHLSLSSHYSLTRAKLMSGCVSSRITHRSASRHPASASARNSTGTGSDGRGGVGISAAAVSSRVVWPFTQRFVHGLDSPPLLGRIREVGEERDVAHQLVDSVDH